MDEFDINDGSLMIKRFKQEVVLMDDAYKKKANKVEPGYLTNLAMQIEQADSFVNHTTMEKLNLIKMQMNHLRCQAAKILIDAKISSVLNSLPCNFVKKPGSIYHVFQKPNQGFYISMLSEKEWGSSCPHGYIGSFKFTDGMSWLPIDEISKMNALKYWANNEDILEIL